MINEMIVKGLQFVRKNPTILYSLLLIAAVTGIIFFNSYYSLRKFEDATDKLLHSKALLAGKVLKTLSADSLDDTEYLSKKINEIKKEDLEIRDISILVPESESGKFSTVATTTIGEAEESVGTFYAILWNREEAIAFLGNDGKGRFWNVGDIVRNSNGEKIGIVIFRLSLSSHDEFIQNIINRVYYVAIASLIAVLLLVANHARLFKYEIKAAKLEEIDKMKDDFISMASHELRSPLTALRGYIELLGESLRGKEQVGEAEKRLHYLENMDSMSTRLGNLVEDLLEVSRLEQNRMPIEMEDMDLAATVNKMVDEMKVAARRKKIEMVDAVHGPLLAKADSERVKQILTNLLSNAIKYTPSGKVEIKSKSDDKFVYVTVADTGLGMSAENMKKLFSKFYRVQSSQTAGIPGTGLGLWISREIALKMGGDLMVESIEGVGSHFTLKVRKA